MSINSPPSPSSSKPEVSSVSCLGGSAYSLGIMAELDPNLSSQLSVGNCLDLLFTLLIPISPGEVSWA